MEERGLEITRKKTEYLVCNEHQDAQIHLQGETVMKVKTYSHTWERVGGRTEECV